MKNLLTSLLLVVFSLNLGLSQEWTYKAVDSVKQKWGDWEEPNWLRYFGLDAGDVNNDGLPDLLSGRYLYRNPGNASEGTWKRTVLDDNVDGIFIMDVDGDAFADLIAQALPQVFWYEAVNLEGTRFTRKLVAQIPATTHVNSQGFERFQLVPGGPEEILIAGNGNIYLIQIPAHPANGELWPTQLIGKNTSDEGIGIGDIDGDGDPDLASGRRKEGQDEPRQLVWFENQGRYDTIWKDHLVGSTAHPIDRVKVADLDQDQLPELIVTEERYPGLEPDSRTFWFSRKSGTDEHWQRNELTAQYSTNSLDIGDVDGDGDMDILIAEHKGPKLELQLWQNSGSAVFTKEVIDTGKENHLGAKLTDIDGDGDLDIIGAAWDDYRWVHLWKNQRLIKADTSQLPIMEIKPAMTDSLVTEYQGKPHFVIRTSEITYYYDIEGGGFSRMIDRQGNDWISFKEKPLENYPQGAAGAFRGIPNLVYQGEDNGVGHPGFKRCKSWFEDGVLHSESLNKKWKWRWTFKPDHAILHILKTDIDRSYWFLYEGTPGGRFDPGQYYYGTDLHGPNWDTPDFYKENAIFKQFKWAYVGTQSSSKTFYMLNLSGELETGIVSYLGNSEKGIDSLDGMTVFGFGRGRDTNPLLRGESSFVIGLYPQQINTKAAHQSFTDKIQEKFKLR